ncbi:MAG: thiamine pyrophosphate-dependent enzyme [Desulfobacterales bacterium]|jgi:pyruvate ferredoxin oxidoreductase beta subunit/2-oxoisovalerate ferredoxin oxidoreductase beta subunit
MQKTFNISRELSSDQELLQPGVLSCQGCGASLAMKLALMGLGERTVVIIPASCWGIIVGVWPYSTLKVPVIHVPFATAAVTASGIKAAFDKRGERDVVIMAWAGDGGTFDIGIQSLSGAAERNDDILYVCYDNEAYMNTGIQRSSATPAGAWTTTTPAGSVKREPKKDLEKIMLGHDIPYIATASVAYPDDMIQKFNKVRGIRGTKLIHLLCPCPPGWRIDSAKSIQVTRMATLAKVFPIYEIENGKYRLNVQPGHQLSVKQYLRAQGRFRQMPDEMVAGAQQMADRKWEELVELAHEE